MDLKRLLIRVGMLIPMLLILAQVGFAQGKTVSGKVTDSKDGSPVAGASVTVKGTNRGTTTDATGAFRITVDNNNAVLVITSVGFTRQEVAVGAQTDLSINLVASQSNLNEVVVVGYGTQRKRDLTGAVATVTSKDFVKGAIQTPEQLIAGKVAGVQITPNSGAPGSGSTIRIRGGASLNASNSPLIIIDGVPVDGGVAGSSNPLNLVNPNDIENFSILKDPSAAAIYGSRASNGVIIITTKKGRKGKMTFNFGAQTFVSQAAKQIDVLSAQEVSEIVRAEGSLTSKLTNANTDWQDQVFRTSWSQDINFSATGAIAKGKLPLRLSAGYLNQDGILLRSNFQRLSGAINLSPRFLKDKLKVDLNLKGVRTTNNFSDEGAVGNAVTFDPTKPVRSGTNQWGGYWEWPDPSQPNLPLQLSNRNPLGLINLRDNTSEVFRSIGNLQLDYQVPFLKGLRANLNLGYDFQQGQGLNKNSDSAASEYRRKGSYRPYFSQTKNNLYEFYLNYVKDVKSINSRFDVMAGHAFQEFKFYSFNNPDRQFNGTVIAGSQPNFISQEDKYAMISYYGRLVYTLAGKYIVTVNARTDGTSRFSPDTRWGFFPSVAGAWRISEEAFLKNSKVISELKLRAGWGVTGQQDGIDLYGYIPRYSIGGNQSTYQFGNNFSPINTVTPAAYDPDLKWETTENINVALDFGLFDNRINGTFEVFQRKTKDLLSRIPIASFTNFSNFLLTNVANIENKGFEVTINTVPVRNQNLQWELGFNVTYTDPIVTNLTLNPDPKFFIEAGGIQGGTGNIIQVHQSGYAPFTYRVLKQVYDKNDKPIEGLYEDLNRDGIINDDDNYLYQSRNAKVFLGASSSISYKRLTAGFVLRGSFGNYNYNNIASNLGVRRQIINPLGFIQNASRDYLETGFVNNQYSSDYYIQNASFIRMDNINFGYDLGEVIKKTRLRLSANIQNAFLITKYKGIDPEVFSGIDNVIYPRPRVFVFGVNMDF
ncbi:TonB-dependent receptor [Lacibacter sp. MH-610]|uniref:SusC/RagA family TonB-linked outer membrane protein n=1 Tax=Lacibacter sp. MH-610 TaxID=3020883 RepID=UPI0038915E90